MKLAIVCLCFLSVALSSAKETLNVYAGAKLSEKIREDAELNCIGLMGDNQLSLFILMKVTQDPGSVLLQKSDLRISFVPPSISDDIGSAIRFHSFQLPFDIRDGCGYEMDVSVDNPMTSYIFSGLVKSLAAIDGVHVRLPEGSTTLQFGELINGTASMVTSLSDVIPTVQSATIYRVMVKAMYGGFRMTVDGVAQSCVHQNTLYGHLKVLRFAIKGGRLHHIRFFTDLGPLATELRGASRERRYWIGQEESVAPDAAEQAEIVQKHNDYRSDVSPNAADMMKMVWNDELAMVAQRWASNCVYKHDENDDRKIPGKYSVGQNMGAGTGQLTWDQMIGLWHAEVSDFEYGTGGAGTGHYTQVVWGASSRIGCGAAKCSNGLTILVCNYAPAGNYYNKLATPYESSATSCSACKDKCENNLCVCEDTATTTSYCKNRGVLNPGTCTCDCSTSAYTGPKCDQCEDTDGLWGYSCEYLKGINYCKYSNIQAACCKTCLGG